MTIEFIYTDKAGERILKWQKDAMDFDQPELVIERITPNYDSDVLTFWMKLKNESDDE